MAWAVCNHDGRAAEAVQEAFISIWKTHQSYDGERGTPAAWILTITRYRAIDILRRHTPHAQHHAREEALEGVKAIDDVAAQVQTKGQADERKTLITALPDAQREVITLAFYGQLSHSEIATQLDMPTGTIKGRMRLGLKRLREAIDEPGD